MQRAARTLAVPLAPSGSSLAQPGALAGVRPDCRSSPGCSPAPFPVAVRAQCPQGQARSVQMNRLPACMVESLGHAQALDFGSLLRALSPPHVALSSV